MFRDHSFSAYTRACAYQGVRNVSFPENFVYVLNESSLIKTTEFNYIWNRNITLINILKSIVYREDQFHKYCFLRLNSKKGNDSAKEYYRMKTSLKKYLLLKDSLLTAYLKKTLSYCKTHAEKTQVAEKIDVNLFM